MKLTKLKYTSTHSNDPYLLMRLYTDLKLCDFPSFDEWNNEKHPFDEFSNKRYLVIEEKVGICFHNHCGVCDPILFELTEKNYTKVLSQILEP